MGRNVNRFIRRGLFSVFCTSFSGVRCTLYISAETNNLCCPKTHRLFPSIHRGVKMGVIIILCRLWDWDFVCKMASSELSGVCFMLRGALNVRFTTLLFHIGPYFRSYWRYPSSKKL